MDVFEGEPEPRSQLLDHPKISVSPHIGASTMAAQEKISVELAMNIIRILSDKNEEVHSSELGE